jgi:hypothetical protein
MPKMQRPGAAAKFAPLTGSMENSDWQPSARPLKHRPTQVNMLFSLFTMSASLVRPTMV